MYSINILIAEDEERLRKLIVKYLKNENYSIFEASNGKEAIQIFEEEAIDLVILDVMMPLIDGWHACKTIRKTSNVPIIMLTARSEEEDKIMGFELGVDDYVTKPFSTRELLARVRALLKRSGKTEAKEEVILGSLVIHTPSRTVQVEAEEVLLSPKEYDLLVYFTDNPNRALSREQILNRVWGYDFFGDGRTVDTVIKRLRKKLGDEGERIQTVRSIGYRFEVEG
ncbi:MAG: DNA-binding response regulator [Firmicutes bacterium HGW-Firmicutes-1]|nr:MAG: DNA-binding response regulator [Firmicutes bacterium HGW-Firmicutes-1]